MSIRKHNQLILYDYFLFAFEENPYSKRNESLGAHEKMKLRRQLYFEQRCK